MERLTRLALHRPVATTLIVLAITGAFASQLRHLGSETGYRAYLGHEHPTIQRLDSFIEGFGGGLPMAAVWSCEETTQCESVFDETALRMAFAVVERLRGSSDIRRIESPATTPLLTAEGESLGTRKLIEDGSVSPDVDELARRAVIDPMWRGLLVSPDGRAAAILLELASSDSQAAVSVLAALRDALAPFEEAGFRFHIVGQTAQFALTDEALALDSAILTVPMIAVVAIIVLWLFRSWQAVAASLVTVGLSTVWTLGLMAALRWPQNSITQTIAPLILVMALSDSIHVLSRYAQHRESVGERDRRGRTRAMLEAAREAGPPCLVTTLTTAAGFASFATSNLSSFVRFGLVCAAGIMSALILSFVVTPVVMTILPAEREKAERSSELWDRVLLTMVEGTRRNANYIICGSMALLLICSIGAFQLRVDIDEYKMYGEQSEVVQGFRFQEANLRKPDTIEIELRLPDGGELHEAETINALSAAVANIEQIEGLGPIHSVLDSLAWTNRLLHGDDPAFENVGSTTNENAELLTVLSMKDPAALDKWLSPGFRRLRLSVEAQKRPQSERGAVIDKLQGVLLSDLGPAWSWTITGSYSVYYDMTLDIQRTQIMSFGTATLIVFLILAFYLRTIGGSAAGAIGWAAVGMFPTILPVVAIFGVMGFAGINLDMGTAMVAAIIIGIAVDDTIHLLAAFYRRREAGQKPLPAIEGAVLHVGQAVLTTSVALSAGFFVLTLSSWQSIASFGFLSGVAVVGALAADLWILPALILFWTRGDTPAPPPQEDGPEKASSTARRTALSVLVVLALSCLLLVAANGLVSKTSDRMLACRTMPNGVVPVVVGTTSRCNLLPFDRVISVESSSGPVPASQRPEFLAAIISGGDTVWLEIERGGVRKRLAVPVLVESKTEGVQRIIMAVALTLVAMTLALRVYWHSKAASAPALLILFAAMCGEVVSIICSPAGDILEFVSAPIAPMIAAAVTHLALTFPRERALVRVMPRIVVLPYALAALLSAVEARGIRFDPTFWTICIHFMLAFATGGATLLGVNAYRAISRSNAPVEQARARMLFLSFLGVPLILTPALFGIGRGLPGGQLTMMLAGCALFVFPLGYSITRYDLFDFPAKARNSIEAGLNLAVIGTIAAVAITLLEELAGSSSPLIWAAGSVVGVIGARQLRTILLRFTDLSLPSSLRLHRNILELHVQGATSVITEAAATEMLGRALEHGIDTTGIAILLQGAEGWRPVYAGLENPAFRVTVAEAADRCLGSKEYLHLVHLDTDETDDIALLQDASVELVMSIEYAGRRIGVVLCGPPRTKLALQGQDIRFARELATQAGQSLHTARLATERAEAERRRAISRRLTDVAHDLGSPLEVLARRAGRIADHPHEPEMVRREASRMEGIATYLRQVVYGMVEHAEAQLTGNDSKRLLADVINAAVLAVEDKGAVAQILMNLDADLPEIHHQAALSRALVNLLDNAIAASFDFNPVWIRASLRGSEVRIDIEDHGEGMDQESLHRAFEPHFTTRKNEGGSGLGLAITKELIEGMGGKVTLRSQLNVGTCARLELPVGRAGT